MQTIDVWGQIPTQRMAESPLFEPLRRWMGASEDSQHVSAEQTLSELDKAGIDVMILSAWYGLTGSLISNEELAAQIAAAPNRFRGLASADIRRPEYAAQQLRDWLSHEQFVGVRILPWLTDLPPNDRRYYPIYALCVELGVPVCTQIGHTGPLMRSETGRLIPYLEDVLLDFPSLKMVGGHLGYPWIDELTTLTIKFPNFYVDTSAYSAKRFPARFVDYMKGIGRDRVMFGSNWPMIAPRQCLSGLEQLGLTDAQEAAYRGEIARTVFKL